MKIQNVNANANINIMTITNTTIPEVNPLKNNFHLLVLGFLAASTQGKSGDL